MDTTQAMIIIFAVISAIVAYYYFAIKNIEANHFSKGADNDAS